MDIVEFLNNPVHGGLKWTIALEKRIKNEKYLEAYGYHVYSQNDEDGIIQEIYKRIGFGSKKFVEFGVDKGIESNCHALLLSGWSGLWIEGRTEAYNQILRRFAPAIRQKKLNVVNEYVSRNNINDLILKNCGFDIDLLSIDIDGNDYHIWKSITKIRPRVVIIEYQGKFPPEINWVMAYNKEHVWDRSDRSGASLKALEELGEEKGYQLVGTNISGVNAFFVRKDLTKDLFPLPATAENLYNPVRNNLIYHHNGNPALNYVGQDIEGMEGVFEYYPDWNILSSFGFWKVEVYPDFTRNIMREKNAKMFIKEIPDNSTEMIIDIYVDVPIEKISPLMLSIQIEDSIWYDFHICSQNNSIKLPIDKMVCTKKSIPVMLKTNVLWISSQVINGGDTRVRGIAIDRVNFK